MIKVSLRDNPTTFIFLLLSHIAGIESADEGKGPSNITVAGGGYYQVNESGIEIVSAMGHAQREAMRAQAAAMMPPDPAVANMFRRLGGARPT